MISQITVPHFGVTVLSCNLSDYPSGSKRESERVAIEALVRHAFGSGALYGHDPDGAPLVAGFHGFISVSHSDSVALLARRNVGPVGVDIERPRRQLERISRKFMTSGELQRYTPDPSTLLRLWTAKEAVFKAAAEPTLTVSRIFVDLEASMVRIPSGAMFRICFLSLASNTVAVAIPDFI